MGLKNAIIALVVIVALSVMVTPVSPNQHNQDDCGTEYCLDPGHPGNGAPGGGREVNFPESTFDTHFPESTFDTHFPDSFFDGKENFPESTFSGKNPVFSSPGDRDG